MQFARNDYTTVEESAAVASFLPITPGYVPDGYDRFVVEHTYPIDGFSTQSAFSGAHNDQVGIYYRNADGRQLAVVEGFPGDLHMYDTAQAGDRGIVSIDGQTAYWVRWAGAPGTAADDQIMLYWEAGRLGSGYEISADRQQISYGSPLSISVASNSLSLGDLVAVAESLASQ